MRPPCTVSFEKSASSALRSPAVSRTSSAPEVLVAPVTFVVPGIGTIDGFCARDAGRTAGARQPTKPSCRTQSMLSVCRAAIFADMRRALFLVILAVLLSDASGVSSLLVPETCPIGTRESAPDSGCPAFCVRCTCACCAPSIELSMPPDTAVAPVPLRALTLASSSALPPGSRADILHVPKTLI